jgi:hypothetical protein
MDAAPARKGDEAYILIRGERAEHVGDVIYSGGVWVTGGVTVTDLVSLPEL